MQPESRKYLWDASQAADRITRFITGRTLDQYQADDLLRSAVERQFEIIGESLAQLRKIDPGTAAAIPELPRIVAFRNILIHGYATVDERLVWGVIEGSLLPLRAILQQLLDSA
ncbi:MAG: HepT-like ribonuclease domain-containing protein [Pseudomonadota bacterium]